MSLRRYRLVLVILLASRMEMAQSAQGKGHNQICNLNTIELDPNFDPQSLTQDTWTELMWFPRTGASDPNPYDDVTKVFSTSSLPGPHQLISTADFKFNGQCMDQTDSVDSTGTPGVYTFPDPLMTSRLATVRFILTDDVMIEFTCFVTDGDECTVSRLNVWATSLASGKGPRRAQVNRARATTKRVLKNCVRGDQGLRLYLKNVHTPPGCP